MRPGAAWLRTAGCEWGDDAHDGIPDAAVLHFEMFVLGLRLLQEDENIHVVVPVGLHPELESRVSHDLGLFVEADDVLDCPLCDLAWYSGLFSVAGRSVVSRALPSRYYGTLCTPSGGNEGDRRAWRELHRARRIGGFDRFAASDDSG